MALTDPQAGLISAGIGAGSGIISSIFGARQAAKNRAWQMRMQQMQNDFNAKQAELAFQRNQSEWTRQFDLTNRYNSPSAQMERYEAAGINPYMAAGNIQGGTSSASPSASGAPAASSSSVPFAPAYSNPAQNFFSGVQDASQSALSVLSTLEKSRTVHSDIASRIADNLLNSELYGVKKEALETALKSQASRNNYDAAYYTLKLHKVDDIVAQEFAQMMARTEELITQVKLNETNEKLAYQKEREIRVNFNTWKEGYFLDNDVKRSQRDNIDAGTKQSWQYMNNALADSAQSRRESNSRIALNGLQGALLGVQAMLGRQQFGFNASMNPFLIHNQAMANALQRQLYRFNADSNPYRINSLIWANKSAEQLFNYNRDMFPLNILGKQIQNYNEAERGIYNTFSDLDNIKDNLFGGQLDFNLGIPFGKKGKGSSLGFSRHKVYRGR